MGPSRKLPEHIETKMLEYLQARNISGDPIQKFIFKKEVDEYLTERNLLTYFGGSLPSM